MRVLVVEDEPRMADLIRQGLEEDGYAVDTVDNGKDVLPWVESASYDCIVLDIMLPGMDGISVCRRLREQSYKMNILILTARDAVHDRVTGLDAGADDYLVKPFAIEELTARLRALSRREGQRKTVTLQVGDLILNTATKRATRGSRDILPLTSKEYTLLETLMNYPDQVLTREQIIEKVWNWEYASESKLIEVYISSLRKKIDRDSSQKLIQTVRGIGYRIGSND